jgi:multidrug efflux pump subunit AcrA (membrane-fusion protein)
MREENQHSEELFETLSKNKKRKRRRLLRTVLIVIAVVAVILVGLVFYLRQKVEQRFAAAAAEVLRYEVQTGTIHTVVSGSGTLTQVAVEDIAVPTGVEITEVLVENRDAVKKGDILATVDMATVMTALADVQEQLDEMDEEISDAKGDTVSSMVTAGVAGRVKRLLAQTGTDVTACMAEHGALAYLSLDGYMAVDIKADGLDKGQEVTVIRADGSRIAGRVDSSISGKTTVLVTDNGPEYGEEVTAETADGKVLGSGALYIHSPLAVTGYAGTVSGVSVRENAQVYKNTGIYTLKDTSFSANYDTLLRNRQDLEETLLELLAIYRVGAVAAPFEGTVSSILYDENMGPGQTDILTLYPGKEMAITISVDETDILALREGQEADVVVSSVSEDPMTGTVTEITREAVTSSGVSYYSAEITVDHVAGMLPGMTADVDVKIEGVENAIIIPVEALRQTSAISYVFTTYDEETKQYGGMVEVTTGMQNDSYVEIRTGLKVGDTVCYTKQQNFFEAMFSAMGGGMGGNMGGGQRPGMGGGQRPNMGGGMPGGMGG